MVLSHALFSLLLFTALSSHGAVISVSVDNFEESLNQALQAAQKGDTIQMPAGRFQMRNELLINRPGMILRGMGPEKTVLNFKNQKAGPQGIIATKNQIVFSQFAVEDTAGNGIKVIGSQGVVFDKVRVTWTEGPSEKNGSYGIYPVLTSDVLIQDCEVSGASDAGLYVGQSKNVIVRRNFVHGNVAGLEIENSSNVDVYQNRAFKNTVGMLVFNLPDLLVKTGQRIRFFWNQSNDNNLKNFSTPGSIINLVPQGAGMLILAAQNVEIFENEFLKNKLTGISVNNYLISERKITDTQYDPMPKGIAIFDNKISQGEASLLPLEFPEVSQLFSRGLISDSQKTTLIIKLLLGVKTPSVITDGIMDGTYTSKPALGADRICIHSNLNEKGKPIDFGNLHLDSPNTFLGLPTGPATRSLVPHLCTHPRLPEIILPPMSIEPGNEPRPSPEEIQAHCKSNPLGKDQVNRGALDYDCPDLEDYNLFQKSEDATQSPLSQGFHFKPSSELFTDYSEKSRFVFVPPGESILFDGPSQFDFPNGTVLAKTFQQYILNSSGKPTLRPLETRLLIKRQNVWVPLNYIWDGQGKKAKLKYGGEVISMKISPQGTGKPVNIDYHVPNLRQCASCHSVNDQILPLGFKGKFLNWNFKGVTSVDHSNLLDQMQKRSLIKGLPADLSTVDSVPSWTEAKLTKENRVKAYLDINCAHCHNPQGNARNTGLFLSYEVPANSRAYGICKTPVAAGIGSGGHKFAIQPSSAKNSVLIYRMTQSHLAVKMPQLGRSAVHEQAVDLISQWINEMPSQNCETN